MLLQIMCISFLFFTFVWEEYKVVIYHFLNKIFKVKVFDWAETYDSDSEESDSGDEEDSGTEEAGEDAAPTDANANANLRQGIVECGDANLRHRIVECGDDTAAVEKATREIQQKLHESLATTT